MASTREQFEDVLRRLNDGENRRPETGVEEAIEAIDGVMAATVEGWTNGQHTPNREAERATERVLFALIPDYHRRFDRVIIEPPFASVAWTITGTANGTPLVMNGCSNFELDEDAKIARYWLYLDSAQLGFLAG